MELTMALKCGLLLVVSCALLTSPVAARPPHRQKRVSDQRLAELETLLALAKMKNRKYVTLPVGYGLIDVRQIGRRKRSATLSAAAAAAAASGHRPFVQQDPTATDYDLSEIIADLSSTFAVADTEKEEPILEGGNYSEDEEPNLVAEGEEGEERSLKEKGDFVLGGLRPGSSRAIFLGMRPHHRQQLLQHPRFI